MRIIAKLICGVVLLGLPLTGFAAVSVFTCEPEWAALVNELSAGKVKVNSATTAQQDPHIIQARPSLIAKARRANLLVCTGADLEVGWLPLLLRQAANPRIQPRQPGHFMAADHVPMLDVPKQLDRSAGDVHPYGNPHIHLDPRNISKVAAALSRRLMEIDPNNTDAYAQARKSFLERWDRAIVKWESQAQALRGKPVVVQHNSWLYLENWLGFKIVAALEPKPGLPPSAAHLGRLVKQMASEPAQVIIRSPYQPASSSKWLSERTGIKAIVLPYTVGGSEQAKDLFGLFDATIESLLKATAP